MTDAPERIWAWEFMPDNQNEFMKGGWDTNPDKKTTEYIRKDVADAQAEARYRAGMLRAAEIAEDHLPRDRHEARRSTPEYNMACRDIAAAIRKEIEE